MLGGDIEHSVSDLIFASLRPPKQFAPNCSQFLPVPSLSALLLRIAKLRRTVTAAVQADPRTVAQFRKQCRTTVTHTYCQTQISHLINLNSGDDRSAMYGVHWLAASPQLIPCLLCTGGPWELRTERLCNQVCTRVQKSLRSLRTFQPCTLS
jgi:hypothetical protein